MYEICYPRVQGDIEREVEAISIILVAYFLVFRIFLEGGDSPGTGPGIPVLPLVFVPMHRLYT
jgi:hypothetical protein